MQTPLQMGLGAFDPCQNLSSTCSDYSSAGGQVCSLEEIDHSLNSDDLVVTECSSGTEMDDSSNYALWIGISRHHQPVHSNLSSSSSTVSSFHATTRQQQHSHNRASERISQPADSCLSSSPGSSFPQRPVSSPNTVAMHLTPPLHPLHSADCSSPPQSQPQECFSTSSPSSGHHNSPVPTSAVAVERCTDQSDCNYRMPHYQDNNSNSVHDAFNV